MKFQDLDLAFHFVSSAQPLEHTAYISKSTGEAYYHSEMGDFDEIPEEVYESDDYIEIPHKNDLDLGKQLVWDFVEQEIPGLKDKVRSFFSRKGAYSRYKDFLEQIGLLDKWYEFENTKAKEALLEWCKKNKIGIEE
ncbi:UPF0158 family protein [Chlamydiota bacterium]